MGRPTLVHRGLARPGLGPARPMNFDELADPWATISWPSPAGLGWLQDGLRLATTHSCISRN
ncbi:hypothetical protein TorRG33x02_301380, partial [Trema orientale]